MNPICKWSPNTPQAPTHFLALPPASTPGLTSLRPPSHMGSVTESLQRWTKIHLDLPAGVRTPRRRSMLMFPVHDFALARRTHARSSLQSVRALQCARKPGRWRIDIHTHIYIYAHTYVHARTHTYIYMCEYVYTCVGIHVYPALVRKLVVTVPGQELVRFKAFPDASVSPVQARAASEDRTHDFRVIKFTRCQLRYQCRGDAGPTFAIAAMIIPLRFFQHFSRCARSPLFIPILLLRGALGLERVAGGAPSGGFPMHSALPT